MLKNNCEICNEIFYLKQRSINRGFFCSKNCYYESLRRRPKENIKQRFLKKIKKNKQGCWVWNACSHPTGYGRFGFKGRDVIFSHRASWIIFNGEIPKGLYVCHKCDVRNCVNPEHLFIGTAKDNIQDAVKKGRIKIPKYSYASDETHQVAKLTNKQVLLIRKSKKSNRYFSDKYNVTPGCIWAARTKRTFRDI